MKKEEQKLEEKSKSEKLHAGMDDIIISLYARGWKKRTMSTHENG